MCVFVSVGRFSVAGTTSALEGLTESGFVVAGPM